MLHVFCFLVNKELFNASFTCVFLTAPEDLRQVLMTLIQGGVEFPDPVVKFYCSTFLESSPFTYFSAEFCLNQSFLQNE